MQLRLYHCQKGSCLTIFQLPGCENINPFPQLAVFDELAHLQIKGSDTTCYVPQLHPIAITEQIL